MDTIRYQKEDQAVVAELLKEGEVIAFPTDTVYGLGVVYYNENALMRLKEAKGRPEAKPIPTMVADVGQIEKIAFVEPKAKALIQAFMPGAFTIILKKREDLPAYVTNGFPTIGIRMPDDDFVLGLIRACEVPLLVTSANLSDYPSAVTDHEVLDQLDGRIDGIVMGKSKATQASTIVDVSDGSLQIIRSGLITEAEIRRIWEGAEG